MDKSICILGIRGIPAQHGGFETFAEQLSLYLASKGWRVTVYCQEEGGGLIYSDDWNAINRVHIGVHGKGALSTIKFDWLSTVHAARRHSLCLVLGYNTAIFLSVLRLMRRRVVINMDGIEWRREKWGRLAKTWFWLNERIGCGLGNHLIADNPAIEDHLSLRADRRKITMIPYGAYKIAGANQNVLRKFNLEPRRYSIIIARPEPENSLLEMVSAFSSSSRGHFLVVLGRLDREGNSYHRRVIEAASSEVLFLGAIYDPEIVNALRFFSCFYLHGHTVGGTNPSLVEALGAGCAVIAHDNVFNRWVAGEAAFFFGNQKDCADAFDHLLADKRRQELMRENSVHRFEERFHWERVLGEYEELLKTWSPSATE